MICPNGHIMPDSKLACPTCTAQMAEKALQTMQVEYLHKAAKGDFGYTLRIAKGSDRHVLLYATSDRTFCGQTLAIHPHIYYEPYSDDTLAKVCAGCRIAIKNITEREVPTP